MSGEGITELRLAELFPPEFHPFQVNDDEAMTRLSENIKKHGVREPGLVRPREDGGYELLCGNRRKRACELAGIQTMPVIIREMDDDNAAFEAANVCAKCGKERNPAMKFCGDCGTAYDAPNNAHPVNNRNNVYMPNTPLKKKNLKRFGFVAAAFIGLVTIAGIFFAQMDNDTSYSNNSTYAAAEESDDDDDVTRLSSNSETELCLIVVELL